MNLLKSRYRVHTLLFGLTIFISSALLFSVQPMIAKMLLPLLGGTPAVWNTCMLFFQAALLCGYAYALLVSRWPLRRQLIVQLAVLAVAFVSLPIGLSASWVNSVPPTEDPSLWLLLCLGASVGLPFFIVSSNSPLLQKWFSRTATDSAKDPYFLYAASNAGSLLALLAYPVLLEPYFTLRMQSRIWTILYAVLVALIALHCLLLRNTDAKRIEKQIVLPDEKLTVRRRLRWLLLAFAPSSLMLGVTNYITTDIASVPLLWIIPLALYLLTMVFAFSRKKFFSARFGELIVPAATIFLLLLYLADSSGRGSRILVLMHLGYFFFAALMCHSQLADDRPGPQHLAQFYVWLSLGGVLGGIFNAIVAPLVFRAVVEYPLAILLSCLLLPGLKAGTSGLKERRLDFALPALIGAFTAGLGWFAHNVAPVAISGSVFVVALPMFVAYPLRKRPLRFALSLGAVTIAAALVTGVGRTTLHAERNFFGVLRVLSDQNRDLHSFLHGSTVHGRQNTTLDHRCQALSYYHREGPLGRIFTQFQNSTNAANVAIIGLGTGATISYARPSERWTFYEINPAVVAVARSPQYFTYLSNCAAAPVEMVLGDARLKLHDAPDQSYNLLVLDAFSSDAIPVHLMTQQALDLYLSKLSPGGLLVFHISNRNLDLSGVVADLAKSRSLSALSMLDLTPSQPNGKDPSHWVVLVRNSADYGSLANDKDAKPLISTGTEDVWTDDFSNIISVFQWRKTATY
jgi:spermidine synthase